MGFCFGQRFPFYVQSRHSVASFEEGVADFQTNAASTSGNDNNRVGIWGCFHS